MYLLHSFTQMILLNFYCIEFLSVTITFIMCCLAHDFTEKQVNSNSYLYSFSFLQNRS